MNYRLLSYLLLMLVALVATSCGGSSTSVESGRAQITVEWPDATRLIPNRAQSIVVSITNGTVTPPAVVLARPGGDSSSNPTSNASFPDLDEGEWTATATAFPNADGTGVAQAVGTSTFRIVGGQDTAFSVTMDTTVSRFAVQVPGGNVYVLALNPDGSTLVTRSGSPIGAAIPIALGVDSTLTVTPTNSTGGPVLVDNAVGTPEVLVAVGDPSVTAIVGNPSTSAASVTTVILRGGKVGTSHLEVNYREANRLFRLPLAVATPAFGASQTVTTTSDDVLDVSASDTGSSIGVILDGATESFFPLNLATSPASLGTTTGAFADNTTRLDFPYGVNTNPTAGLQRIGATAWAVPLTGIKDVAVLEQAGSPLDGSPWSVSSTGAGPTVFTLSVARHNPTTGASATTFTRANVAEARSIAMMGDPANLSNPWIFVLDATNLVTRYKVPTSGTALVPEFGGLGGSDIDDLDVFGRNLYLLDSSNQVRIVAPDGTQLAVITPTFGGGFDPSNLAVGLHLGRRVLVFSEPTRNRVIVLRETALSLP